MSRPKITLARLSELTPGQYADATYQTFGFLGSITTVPME